MRFVRGYKVPADEEKHYALPDYTVGILGVFPDPDGDEAVIVMAEMYEAKEDRTPMAPVVVLRGNGEIPENASFVGFIPPWCHVWQVPDETDDEDGAEDGGKEKARVRLYTATGDAFTGKNGSLFGPGSPIVVRGK